VPLSGEKLTELYDLYAEEILAFLVRRTCDPEVAVDVLAETFAVAFEKRKRFRGGDDQTARAWIYTIARRQLADYFRSERAKLRALNRLGVQRRSLTEPEYERIEELAGTRALRELVAGEISRLPEDQREAVRLRVICEQTYESIAGLLGISQDTARARVSRGVRTLRAAVALPNDETTFDLDRSIDRA
jgi:RNA polymerase sigma-70 factor, ECF subfamily